MVDISESKLRQMLLKPWTVWSLPGCSTEFDSVKLREVYKPKEPDKPVGICNLLPASLMHLYGTKPDIEYFSVTKCPGCKNVMKSQWMAQHYKRDSMNNMVCRKTEMIVAGGKCLGKATTPLHELRESTRNPLLEFSNSTPSISSSKDKEKDKDKYSTSHSSDIVSISPTRSKNSSSHKTEHVSSSSSSKSKSSSHSQSSSSKKHSSSSSNNNNSSSSSSSKSKSISKSSSSSSISWSSSSKKESSSKSSHKSSTPTSYVLSIPSDDSGQNDTLESLLSSNSTSKQTMHIITMSSSGKKSGETEYEQLKFYADSSDKRSKSSSALEPSESSKQGHKIASSSSSHHQNSDSSNFKIPLKNRPSTNSSSSGSVSNSESSKKSKSSHSSSHHSKSSSHESSSKSVFRSSSSSSKVTPIPTLMSPNESKEKGSSSTSHQSSSESKDSKDTKERSSSSGSGHSKKKKKKKDKDEPRKVIPLKDRAFHPDQHCGVVVSDEQHPCTRSLTCKTHSIALRRAVPGRSHPFDSLLAAHKKARDEEKNAKAKDHGEESKIKLKKSSSQSTSGPDIIINPVVHSVSSTKEVTSGVVSTKGHGTFVVSTPSVPPAVISSSQSSNGKTLSTSSKAAPSAAASGNSSAPPPQRQLPKSNPTPKSSNKPVIVIEEEKKEHPGLSYFDIVKEPENTFVYVSSIQPPKSLMDLKGSDWRSTRNITALSEWNPLDRWMSRKGKVSLKKKGFKDPLVKILPSKLSGEKLLRKYKDTHPEATSITELPTAGKDSSSSSSKPLSNEPFDKSGSNSRLSKSSSRHKIPASNSSASKTVNNDSSHYSQPVKKRRLLKQPKLLYESLLFNPSSKESAAAQNIELIPSDSMETDLVELSDESTMVVKTAVAMIQSELKGIGFPLRDQQDVSDKHNLTKDISPEAKEFVINFVNCKSAVKESILGGEHSRKESNDSGGNVEGFQQLAEDDLSRCVLS